jgi:hypothetical protein
MPQRSGQAQMNFLIRAHETAHQNLPLVSPGGRKYTPNLFDLFSRTWDQAHAIFAGIPEHSQHQTNP